MIKHKQGTYCIHNSIEYKFNKVIGDNALITSYNRNDLNNGFVCDLNEDFIKKYGFYCQKTVPKSEITEAYEIETCAIYKGIKFKMNAAMILMTRLINNSALGDFRNT